MDGQLCHLVRGKDQGRHSCPVPGLSLDSMSSVLSSAPVHLPQAPIHLLCASWTLHGAASRAAPSAVPCTGGTGGPGGNFTSGAAQLFSPREPGGHFYSPEWNCPFQECPRNLELPGHQLSSVSRPRQQPLPCSFQSHLFLVQSFSDGRLPPPPS